MGREAIFSGTGGQGVQLIAKTYAHAATQNGSGVMFSSDYGQTMRGGPSLATVVIGDAPLHALPLITKASTAIAMHHMFFENVEYRLRPNALAVVNSTLFTEPVASTLRFVGVPATDIAAEACLPPVAAGFVLLGAFCTITGDITVDLAIQAMTELMPSYRRQHIEANGRALQAGASFGESIDSRLLSEERNAEVGSLR